MNPPPRLKHVAEAAGVSVMTVSLALRNHSSLPARTRTRIQKIATNLGYRPDPNISQLMERVRGKKPRKTGTVLAYLTAHEDRFGWKEKPTQRDYHNGAARRADELGYSLEEFWLRSSGMNEQRLSQILRNRGIEGVIVAPLPNPGKLYQKFQWQHFSAVELGYSLLNPTLHRACNQQFSSMVLLLNKLAEAGYRRIGLAMAHSQDERVNHHWRAAYLSSLSVREEAQHTPMFLGKKNEWSPSGLLSWLGTAKPDVVVTVGTDAQTWLTEHGLRIPDDIALANVDINETMPGISGINQNALQVGAASVDLLISQMRTGERGLPAIPRTLMVDGSFVQGQSTHPRTAPRKRHK